MNMVQYKTEKVSKKRVFYTGSGALEKGEPLCYNYDSTTDLGGETVAEGNQNESKFLQVEDPAAANIQYFAGVTANSHSANAAGQWIEVYQPNGAIVEVRTDLDCVVGVTVLAIEASSDALTVPLAASSARPVAIAMETKDRSGTTGIVLAKLCPDVFLYQKGANSSLVMDDEAAAAETVNSIDLIFNGTGGPKRGLYAVGEIAGAGHATWARGKLRTNISAAASQAVHALTANLHIKDDGTLTDSGEYASSALYVTVETETTTTPATLSGGSLAGIYIGYYVNESTAAPSEAYALWLNSGPTYNWDGLFKIQGSGDVGDFVSSGDAPAPAAGDWMIPISVAGTTYYLVALQDSGV